MADQQTDHIYRALWNGPTGNHYGTRFFHDEETAKEYIEEYIWKQYGLRAGEWEDERNAKNKQIMFPENGDGWNTAEVTRVNVDSTVPEIEP